MKLLFLLNVRNSNLFLFVCLLWHFTFIFSSCDIIVSMTIAILSIFIVSVGNKLKVECYNWVELGAIYILEVSWFRV